MRLWSFIRSLFRRQRPPPPVAEPPAVAEPSPAPAGAPEADVPPAAAPEAELHPVPVPVPIPVEEGEDHGDDDEDEDFWAPDDDEEPDGEPDPFIHGPAPDFDFKAEEVAAQRLDARAAALGGEHRLPLSTPAGPGSLAEALNILLEEGSVEAEFVDDPQNGPFMLYRPTRR